MNGSSMWEAPFVKTFQNKDTLLIYTVYYFIRSFIKISGKYNPIPYHLGYS